MEPELEASRVPHETTHYCLRWKTVKVRGCKGQGSITAREYLAASFLSFLDLTRKIEESF